MTKRIHVKLQVFATAVVTLIFSSCQGILPLAHPEQISPRNISSTPELALIVTSQSPVPSPTPTQTSQPVTPSLPTVISIPRQEVTSVDILEPGLNIVYFETSLVSDEVGETNIWMSNVTKLDRRKLLTKIGPHKRGYWPGGEIAPDSKKLLYSLTPVNLPGSEAHKSQREIWMLDIESGKQVKLLAMVNGFVKWLPDSQTIMYAQDKYDDMGGVETQISLMSIVEQRETPVFSTSGWGFSPLSFLDNQTLLYLDWKSDVLTEARTLDLSSGATELLQAIDVPRPWENYSISPDNTTLLITSVIPGKEYELITISLATGEKKLILSFPLSSAVDSQPIYRLDAQWLPDNQTLSIHLPPRAGQPAHLSLTDLKKRTSPQPILADSTFLAGTSENNEAHAFLMPGFWSPDGQLLTLAQYPRVGQEVYVFDVVANTMTRIPAANPSFGISIIGWIE